LLARTFTFLVVGCQEVICSFSLVKSSSLCWVELSDRADNFADLLGRRTATPPLSGDRHKKLSNEPFSPKLV
jgi:hypothetical protein